MLTVLSDHSFLEAPRWRDGRLWISDFYTHRVLSCREDGSDLRVEAEVPAQPSGLGWLPDGRLLVVSQRDHRVLRREPDGTLAALTVAPDGICADAGGGVWAADALGDRAVRVLGGEVVDQVDAGTGVYACALGGEDGRTLFLCTAPSFAEHERRDTREARMLSTTVEVPAA